MKDQVVTVDGHIGVIVATNTDGLDKEWASIRLTNGIILNRLVSTLTPVPRLPTNVAERATPSAGASKARLKSTGQEYDIIAPTPGGYLLGDEKGFTCEFGDNEVEVVVPQALSSIQRNRHVSSPEYSNFIALSRYARWLPEHNRRETWDETVGRYVKFWVDRRQIQVMEADRLIDAISNLDVMPSMRALMTAGKALELDNVAGFNCSYTSISRVTDFDEVMYISMCGTGVGFSCERQFTNQLPVVGSEVSQDLYKASQFHGVEKSELSVFDPLNNMIHVADSKYGWASALRVLVVELFRGNFGVRWDVSQVRPAGAPLAVFGGRASGPKPLVDCFRYFTTVFRAAKGRQLTSVEAHGLVCIIAQVVVSGGVRRSALISLSNPSDDRMRHAKSGEWWTTNPEYGFSNNSVAYTEKPSAEIFMREWLSLIESKSGERGIFSRPAAQKQAARWGKRDPNHPYGCNPCSEIILRDGQFCNLTEIVVRPDDTDVTLRNKAEIATILGTLQATLTDFVYLTPRWKKNTEEEALLGVSLTGILDNSMMLNGAEDLEERLNGLRDLTTVVNQEWATWLGINPSAAITCVKPSGTVSQLVDSASGIHPRYSPYYVRTVRADKRDPLAVMMTEAGFPVEDSQRDPSNTSVFSFPMTAPAHAVYRDQVTAMEQLETWLTYQRHWCHHKPSVTIYVKDDEWMEVGAWVYKHFDEVSGVSFLPHTDHTYIQAPYQEIDEETYLNLLELMPKNVDWAELTKYELEDRTKSAKTMACSGDSCEVVDLT